jgi:hypothetical protein
MTCGITMSMAAAPTVSKMLKGHCPECGANRNAQVVCEHIEKWHKEDAEIWGSETSRILKCGGCDTVYFQTVSQDSEIYGPEGPEKRISYWPAPSRRSEPGWMFELSIADKKLYSLFKETYAALNNDARVLAAIGLRTIFDRVSEKFRVAVNLSFEAKLQALHAKGKIGRSELDSLKILTDAGSAAVHRGWKPTLSQLDTLMNVAESFAHRAFILDLEAKQLKKSIPKRKKKL